MNPYETLEPRAFWKRGVAEAPGGDIAALWRPAFGIGPDDPVATAGSCFAQNIGRALKARGMNWLVTEPAPASLPRSLHAAHGYGLFSFRTGNIYSPVLLRQWVDWALDRSRMSTEVWQADGRFFDPFRPSVSPAGFDSAEAVLASRDATAEAVRRAVVQARVFLYTPGLTETWINTETRAIYPACPGTVQGRFDPDRHRCVNVGFAAGKAALTDAFDRMRALNPDLKLLLSVSPVPITATVTGDHALCASGYTKSVLRAIAGEVAAERADVDYFPSYDLVAAPMLGHDLFDANRRTVSAAGVDLVMRHFFDGLGRQGGDAPVPMGDIVCEDEILDFYGKG
jgi:hypothetical protein